jgi:hypothetical protein
MKVISLLLAAVLSTAAVAKDKANDDVEADAGLNEGVIRLAASMNSMALACGHMSAEAVKTAQAKQRDAAIKDMKVAPADFDRLYAGFKADFERQWAGASRAQQQQSCNQMKRN